MPIRYRCRSCGQLLSISTRQIGEDMPCPKCGTVRVVPFADELDFPPEAESQPPVEEQIVEQFSFEDPPAEESSVDETIDSPSPEPFPEPRPEAAAPLQAADIEDDDDDEEVDEFFRPGRYRLRADDEEMDLTPMVDVTFLLLIFFMITASFQLSKTLPFPAPDPENKGAAQAMQTLEQLENTSVIIDIDAEGRIYVDDERIPELGMLVTALRDKLIVEEKNEVVILADNAARHRVVVAVIDAANEVGMQRIRLAAGKG